VDADELRGFIWRRSASAIDRLRSGQEQPVGLTDNLSPKQTLADLS